jgi:hypothetical protein
MTDPTLNNAPVPEPLSPAAQAVLDAVQFELNAERHAPWIAAAAIRELADQAHPKNHIKDISYTHQSYVDGWKDALDVILAIATELEGQ